jgi:quercetin dioxygenase-like cupin family protein
MKPITEMNDDRDVRDVMGALAVAITKPGHVASPTLRDRLLARVRDSAQDSQRMITVRHGDTPWQIVQPGVSARALHDNGSTRTRMVALQPGASWSQALASEVLVVQGDVRLQGEAAVLPAESFVLTADATQWAGSSRGALLYVRELHGAPAGLPAAEQTWWPAPGTPAVVLPAAGDGWLPFSPGVHIKPLHGSEASMSLLARFEPGASVGAHSHGLDEDCIMLRGDLYLGDTLLREGEYQLAPVGTGHRGLASDGPSVLFFHGAIDAALRGG